MPRPFGRGILGMIYFTSDLHFSHKNIINACRRPFHSVENMEKLLIMNWNELVTPQDDIWILGDFSFAKKAKTAEIAGQLNGHKKLVMGNHDHESKSFYESIFEEVYDFGKEIKPLIDGQRQRIVLCHYAMKTWNGSHYGAWNLHGHSHGTLEDDGNSLQHDVGVDVNGYYPISLDRVAKIMANKTFVPVDHHGM